MRKIVLKIIFTCLHLNAISQESISPYKVGWIDGAITIVGAGTAYAGLKVLRNKSSLDSAFVVKLSPQDVNAFDRGATHNFSSNAGTQSDISLFSSFALSPIFLIADKKIRKDGLKVGLIYLETIAVNGKCLYVGSKLIS